MVLHAPGPEPGARYALDRAVVEVAVRQLDAVLERVLAYGESVVLARYLDASGLHVPDRVVRTVVSEGHLVGLAIECEPEELVAEADAEGGDLPEQRTQGVDSLPKGRRVARAVRKEQAVGACGEYLLWAGRSWHSKYRGTAGPQFLVDRALHPVVEGDDAATLLAEGGKQGRFRKLRAGGGEVEANHRRVGRGSIAQDRTVCL